MNWLRDFVEKPRARFETSLVGLSARDVFERIRAGVMPGSGSTEAIPDAYSRFFISHLGMSSFDRVDLLLLEDEVGHERVIWRGADGCIHEVLLEPREMESVAEEFCLAFEPELAR